jgi:hypothetical protein
LDLDNDVAIGAGTGSPFNSGTDTTFPRCWHIAFAGIARVFARLGTTTQAKQKSHGLFKPEPAAHHWV